MGSNPICGTITEGSSERSWVSDAVLKTVRYNVPCDFESHSLRIFLEDWQSLVDCNELLIHGLKYGSLVRIQHLPH